MSAAPAPSITGYVTRCYSCGTGSTDGGEYANLTVNTTAPWSGTDALGFVSFMRIWQTNQVSGATTYTDWYQPPASSGSTVHPAWRISNFGDTITIRVASCNSNGVGGAARCSAQSSALVLYTTPDNPSLSTSLSGGNDITLSWSVTGNYTGVQIYKDGGYLGAFGGTSMVDSNVVVGRDHVYQIFSYYTVGGRTLYSSAGSSTNGYVATADTGTNFGTNITYSVPSHGTQNGWMGSYALLGHIAYCVDLFYSDPSTAGKYGKYTQVSSFGLGGKYSGGGSASGQDVDEMSYVLGVWGVLGSNARAEAVDHFIRLRTISGSVQTSAESNRWAQVNSSTQVTYFNSMTSGAANYRGPYTISISRPTALRVNVAGTIVVNVMSATGHAVPGVFVNITTNNGDNPHGQATDASGNATFPVIPDYRGSETVTVTTGDLPLSNVYVSSPTIAGYQRLLEAGLNTTLTDSAQYPVG
jgi:hypothetical protein